MSKGRISISQVTTATLLTWLMQGPAYGLTPFESAAESYLNGDYEKARSSFEQLLKNDQKNARVHYYLGLSHMRLHDREKAGQEFELAESQASDPALKLIAATWLYRLDRHRKKISDNYSVSKPTVANEHGPVSKVYWFYTNWCPKCKMFKASFEQAKSQFKKLSFESYNAEDPKHWKLVSQYKVKAYPTLVYFDNKGKVIENYAAAPMGNTFAHHLTDLGAKASN